VPGPIQQSHASPIAVLHVAFTVALRWGNLTTASILDLRSAPIGRQHQKSVVPTTLSQSMSVGLQIPIWMICGTDVDRSPDSW